MEEIFFGKKKSKKVLVGFFKKIFLKKLGPKKKIQ